MAAADAAKPGGGAARAAVEVVLAPLAMASFVGAIMVSGLLQALALGLVLAAPANPWAWTLLAALVRERSGRSGRSGGPISKLKGHTAAARAGWSSQATQRCVLGAAAGARALPHPSRGNPPHRGRPFPGRPQAALTFAPLRSTPAWAAAYCAFACRLAESYFPTRVVAEDPGSLQADKPYVVGGCLAPPGGALALPAGLFHQCRCLCTAVRGDAALHFPLLRRPRQPSRA
jgi:hypothetical protein